MPSVHTMPSAHTMPPSAYAMCHGWRTKAAVKLWYGTGKHCYRYHRMLDYEFCHYAWRKYSVLPNFSQLLHLGMWHNMRSMKTTVLRAWHLKDQHISMNPTSCVDRSVLEIQKQAEEDLWWEGTSLNTAPEWPPQFLLKEAGGVVWEVSTNSPTHSPLTGHTGCSDFQEWLFWKWIWCKSCLLTSQKERHTSRLTQWALYHRGKCH